MLNFMDVHSHAHRSNVKTNIKNKYVYHSFLFFPIQFQSLLINILLIIILFTYVCYVYTQHIRYFLK